MNINTYATITVPFLFGWHTPNIKVHAETILDDFEEAEYPIPLKNHCRVDNYKSAFFVAPTATFSIGNDALYAYRVIRPFTVRFNVLRSSFDTCTVDADFSDNEGQPLIYIKNADFLDMENVVQLPEALIYKGEFRERSPTIKPFRIDSNFGEFMWSSLSQIVVNDIIDQFALLERPFSSKRVDSWGFSNGHKAVNGNVPFTSPTKHVETNMASFINSVYNSLFVS